jgi:hypothetical protein
LLAAALDDVDVQYVWRFLRAQKIDLAGRKSWCRATIPRSSPKPPTWSGMASPENAIVIWVDEKPSIQALERAQGYLKLPNGRALTGHSHDYKRNGTSTSFAAFEVATGKVTAAHKRGGGASNSWHRCALCHCMKATASSDPRQCTTHRQQWSSCDANNR